MPFSFAVPLGLIIMIIGAILFFATNHRKAAKMVLGIGAVVTLFTLAVIVLAVNSQM